MKHSEVLTQAPLEGAGAEDMFAPFGAQRIVDGDQELLQLKRLNDQGKQDFEKQFGPEFEMGKEAVETCHGSG